MFFPSWWLLNHTLAWLKRKSHRIIRQTSLFFPDKTTYFVSVQQISPISCDFLREFCRTISERTESKCRNMLSSGSLIAAAPAHPVSLFSPTFTTNCFPVFLLLLTKTVKFARKRANRQIVCPKNNSSGQNKTDSKPSSLNRFSVLFR